MASPSQLYALVDCYARLGDHRTGTAVDAATLTWLTGELTALGADVSHDLYAFDRYEASVRVAVDGIPVAAEPLAYSFTGQVRDADPARAVLEPVAADALDGLEQARARARRQGRRALVVATRTGGGGLFLPNQPPTAEPGLPVLLVGEEHAGRLEAGAPLAVEGRADVVPGFTSNLVAAWRGAPSMPYLLVTTPLTGWWSCAGERGTGIALAQALAASLSRRWPVLLVGTTGHELDGLGAAHHLAQGRPAPAAVVHVGASAAAAGSRAGNLSELVRVTVADDGLPDAGRLRQALRATGHPVHAAVDVGWRGEATAWSSFGVPLVSVAGAAPGFHTALDRLPAATTPALLAQVATGLQLAAHALAEQVLGAVPATAATA